MARPQPSPDRDDDQPTNVVDRAARSTVGREATTFGFSILVTVTFGVVQRAHGSPGGGDLVLYAIGAAMSFSLLEAAFSRLFTVSMPQHRTDVMSFGTALNVVSVVGGVGTALLVASILDTDVAWPICPFAAGLVYLALESAETALAERVQAARLHTRASAVDP